MLTSGSIVKNIVPRSVGVFWNVFEVFWTFLCHRNDVKDISISTLVNISQNFNFFSICWFFNLGQKDLVNFQKKYFHQHNMKFTVCLLVEAVWKIMFHVWYDVSIIYLHCFENIFFLSSSCLSLADSFCDIKKKQKKRKKHRNSKILLRRCFSIQQGAFVHTFLPWENFWFWGFYTSILRDFG